MRKELICNRKKVTFNFKKKLNSSKYLILMVIPAIAYYFIFNYIPMYGILIAFKKYSPKLGIWGSKFNNFQNFSFLWQDSEEFWRVFFNTVFIGLGKIIISFVCAIVVALLLNEIRMKYFKKTVQIVVTFPHFLSWVVVSEIVLNLFGRYGAINNINFALFGTRTEFLSNGKFFLGLLFTSDVWKEAGWSSIIYLATMAGISPELYEAADIDGATRLQKIRNITLPAIKATAILLLIMSVGGILSAGFDQIFNLYNKLVYDVSDILDTYIYRSTFKSGQPLGVGTAIGLFKSVIGFILVITTDRIAKACGERGIL